MKVIITDCDHDNIEIEKKVFADAGIEMELKQAITEEEVIRKCQDGDIFIVQYAKYHRPGDGTLSQTALCGALRCGR